MRGEVRGDGGPVAAMADAAPVTDRRASLPARRSSLNLLNLLPATRRGASLAQPGSPLRPPAVSGQHRRNRSYDSVESKASSSEDSAARSQSESGDRDADTADSRRGSLAESRRSSVTSGRAQSLSSGRGQSLKAGKRGRSSLRSSMDGPGLPGVLGDFLAALQALRMEDECHQRMAYALLNELAHLAHTAAAPMAPVAEDVVAVVRHVLARKSLVLWHRPKDWDAPYHELIASAAAVLARLSAHDPERIVAAGGMETAVNCLDTLCKSSSRSTLKQPVMVRAQRHLVTTLLVLGQRSRQGFEHLRHAAAGLTLDVHLDWIASTFSRAGDGSAHDSHTKLGEVSQVLLSSLNAGDLNPAAAKVLDPQQSSLLDPRGVAPAAGIRNSKGQLYFPEAHSQPLVARGRHGPSLLCGLMKATGAWLWTGASQRAASLPPQTAKDHAVRMAIRSRYADDYA